MRLFCVTSLLTAAILAFPGAAPAREWFVPDTFPSIQVAIQSSSVESGDIITVRPGTYAENINFIGKNLTVRSEAGPEVTTIDGGGVWRAVSFESGESEAAVLEGFTVTNGRQSGVGCFGGNPTLIDNIITDNSGPGIYIDVYDGVGPMSIAGNTIAQNNGGGISIYGGCDDPEVTIEANVIRDNTASAGAGIYCRKVPVTIAGNVIAGNTATSYRGGGGICCQGRVKGTIAGNLIADNEAFESAGGILLDDCECSVIDNTIRGNRAELGGGIACTGGSSIIRGNTIMDNAATSDLWGDGGGIHAGFHARLAIADNVIAFNLATGLGGGLYCLACPSVKAASTLFWANSAKGGGGLFCRDTTVELDTMTVSGNSAADAGAGAIFWLGVGGTVSNSIFWDNGAPQHSEIFTATSNLPAFSFCDVKGGWPGTGMIAAEPLFADAPGGDFHLTFDSPCRNAGHNFFVHPENDSDQERDPRIVQGRVDMGADEFFPHLYFRGTVQPGAPLEIRVIGVPGTDPVLLLLGYSVIHPPWPTPYGDLYLELPPAAVFPIGPVPSGGVLRLLATVPAGWMPGERYPFQALVGAWGQSLTRLTNLLVLEVAD